MESPITAYRSESRHIKHPLVISEHCLLSICLGLDIRKDRCILVFSLFSHRLKIFAANGCYTRPLRVDRSLRWVCTLAEWRLGGNIVTGSRSSRGAVRIKADRCRHTRRAIAVRHAEGVKIRITV